MRTWPAFIILLLLSIGCNHSIRRTESNRAVTEQNGLQLNRLNPNGLDLNGINLNSINLNGINLNGINLNQLQVNGINLNGIDLNRIRFNGINLNGIDLNGIDLNGINLNSINLNGINLNGINLNGINLNGINLDRIRLSGIELNHIELAHLRLDGIDLDQVRLGGIALDTIDLRTVQFDGNELAPDEVADVKRVWRYMAECALLSSQCIDVIDLDGSSVQYCGIDGMAPTWYTEMLPSGAVEAAVTQCVLDRAELENQDVSHHNQEAEAVERVFFHMIACALPSDRCVELIDIDGASHTFCGVNGHDPGWETGPADVDLADAVADCVAQRADQGDDIWLDYIDNFKLVLSYAISCALPQDENATLTDENGDPWFVSGSLGLAPWWQGQPLDAAPDPLPADTGQKRVSACLAARTNALAQPVMISLRAPEIVTSPVERQIYDHSEGAFWANLFSDEPYVETCLARGGGLSGRICADGFCGFTHNGNCAAACGQRDELDEYFLDCNGEVAVVTTFLNLGNRSTFGHSHACARKDDVSLWCWGKGDNGQLGNGTTGTSEDPIQVIALGNEVAESNGINHHCARKTDGSLWCWGKNNNGQLGDGTESMRTSPIQVAALGNDVISFGTHELHTCAVKSNGTLWCWGNNSGGELGDGTTTKRKSPVEITALGGDVASVSHGHGKNTCSIKNDGTVWCSGPNDLGQCGTGLVSSRELLPAQVVRDDTGLALDGITDVCTGFKHVCGRRYDGTVWCWGDNQYGQLGHGSYAAKSLDAIAVALGEVEAVPGGLACGLYHNCAIGRDGSVSCWGHNANGELGNGTFQWSSNHGTPTQVIDLAASVAHITASREYTCAILSDRTTWCWGRANREVFEELKDAISTPVEVDIAL